MAEQNKRARNLRVGILVFLLALMLVGLWYDRWVARPGVDNAWEQIEALNREINEAAEKRLMTNVDVQQRLKRKPSRVMTEGPYQIEVYSWMAGMPFRTRDYFAVYTRVGNELRFSTHYKTEIPPGELVPREDRLGTPEIAPPPEGYGKKRIPAPGMGGMGGMEGKERPGREKGKRGKEEPGTEGKGKPAEPQGDEAAKEPEAQPGGAEAKPQPPGGQDPGSADQAKQNTEGAKPDASGGAEAAPSKETEKPAEPKPAP